MSDACVDPSGLHLKKELTALRKARFLRDPETSSSWRSPLSSRSVAATYSWNCGTGARGDSNGAGTSSGLFELDSTLPSRSENNQKKVFLYNWKHQSSKSIDTGVTPDGDNMQRFVPQSPEDSFSDVQKGDGDTNLNGPITAFRVRGMTSETPTRRVARKFKKSTISSKQYIVRNSPISEQLDLPSSSLKALSIGQSDDTDYCNSEDLQISDHKFARRAGYTSCLSSPFLSHYENWSHSSKILKSTRKGDLSCSYTPASTSSYNRYRGQYPSTTGSWDCTTTSFDGDEVDQLDLLRQKGCGIPCYWSKRTKRGGRGSCSPSLSDTLRKTGSSILCGSQRMHRKRRSSTSNKQRTVSKSVHSLPLLTNSCEGGGSSIDTVSDELLTNFDELDLEALSRLDGRRSLSCKSQERLELALTVRAEKAPDSRSLNQKYRPRSFDELVGQSIVVQSLNNAILRGRIAPVYLFQGPHGTGKTSTARVFAAALNCQSTGEAKPCGFCSECTDVASGKSMDIMEVDAAHKKGIDRVRHVLKKLSGSQSFSRYRVFIIKGCHMLPSKAWSAFLKFLEEPPSLVVFLFVTTDPDSLPRAVVSRCQKYLFPKIKDADIVTRLKKLSAEENMDFELDALDLIALNSDGSLRDAEMMLDQLSLLGKRITASLVNDLVGVVPDEKLLDLLELAMSSDTAETVKRARELMDSGIDPMALMSQLADLIMDIITGTQRLGNAKSSGAFFAGRSLTESEVERLKQALKILSEAEKQLRVSSERSTWFTAALLQLGSGHSPVPSHSSHKKMKENLSDTANEASAHGKRPDGLHMVWKSSSDSMLRTDVDVSCLGDSLSSMPMTEGSAFSAARKDITAGKRVSGYLSTDKLDEIWRRCIERCHSKTLKQLLRAHGKLVSISDGEGVMTAYIAFGNKDIKSRAERFLSSITNSIETVLRCNVEVRMGLIADGENSINRIKAVKSSDSMAVAQKQMEMIGMMGRHRNADNSRLSTSSYQGPCKEQVNLTRNSFNGYECMLRRTPDSCDGSLVRDETFPMSSLPIFSREGNIGVSSTKGRRQENPMQRMHASTQELRLESAWLHTAEKGTPGSVRRLKPERNQVLPQDGIFHEYEMASVMELDVSSKHWEDEVDHEIKSLEVYDNRCDQKDPSGRRVGHYPMSPSLLHSNSLKTNFDKENLGYESGPGCNGLLCWKTTKPSKVNVKQVTHTRSHKPRCYLWFGQCGKSKTPKNRIEG
ncbi:protein STICHEL [Magnolia sinica]|uniref:protein STICHEL n=1 Tax=Magnolia sinica TaxID=86752 RepID=UPI002657B415|nr:protein STICHEL [Magnolia sinica]